jgi:chemotaxis protein MotB
MRPRPKSRTGTGHERWLVSYADFITLLFAFFVVLYSSSQVDRQKVGKLAAAIQVAFQQLGIFQESPGRAPLNPNGAVPAVSTPATPPAAVAGKDNREVQRLMQTLQRTLAPEIEKRQVRLRAGTDGVVLSVQEIGFYDPGSDTLRPGAESFFDRLMPVLLEYATQLRIEGHTDNVPIHNAHFASNWELSTARATGLVRLFVEQYKVPASRLSAAGYAEFHPAASNDTAEGRSLNRRIDLVILPPEKALVPAAAGGPAKLPDSGQPPLASTTSGLVMRVLSSSR